MVEEVIWIPTVKVGRQERTKDFVLVQYGAKEGAGGSYVVGNLIQVSKVDIEEKGMELVLKCLRGYKMWPSNVKFASELATMEPRKRSKFITEHQFVTICQRDSRSISLAPNHRIGPGWRGLTDYFIEEERFSLPLTQEAFHQALNKAFRLADL